jgi:hypothetical protein
MFNLVTQADADHWLGKSDLMDKHSERQLLKLAVAVACLVPLAVGASGVVLGPAVIGADMAGNDLDLESHFR